MNTKTLISSLALTLALGTLALPGSAAARDNNRDGDRQEQHRDRGEQRRHDTDRQRHERNRHDNGHHYGQIHWAPYIPKYQPKQRVYQMHNDGGYFDPRVILHIETHL